MTTKYLIDTCTWRDFYEDRDSYSGKRLGKFASSLFTKILKSKSIILFSESLLWELKKDYPEQDVIDMLNLLTHMEKLQRIEITNAEYLEAKKLAKERTIPFVDCLNAVHARNHGAIMVSEDNHFQYKLNDIVKAVKPSEIN